jgi:hypothetical protein
MAVGAQATAPESRPYVLLTGLEDDRQGRSAVLPYLGGLYVTVNVTG